MSNEKILVKINVKNFGSMTAELYPEYAPITVENFVNLVKEGFYEGLIFHRVIRGFMIQGGGMKADFSEKRCASIKGEFASNGCTTNTLKHSRGVLSMARTMIKDSASSQFFVMHQDAPHLDGEYAAFGKLTDGFDVLDKIAAVRTTRYGYFSDVPAETVEIESVELL